MGDLAMTKHDGTIARSVLWTAHLPTDRYAPVLILGVVIALLASPAFAQPVEDQAFEPASPNVSQGLWSLTTDAQTFTVGIEGHLVGFEVYLSTPQSAVRPLVHWSLQATSVPDGYPGGSYILEGYIQPSEIPPGFGAWVPVDVIWPLPVVPGDVLAIVLHGNVTHPTTVTQWTGAVGPGADYAGGQGLKQTTTGLWRPSIIGESVDFGFRTYVEPVFPDLVIGDVDAGGTALDCTDLEIGGEVVATVRNEGDGTAAPFDVIFFEDSNGNGEWDDGIDLFLGTGASSSDLAAGEETMISAVIGGAVTFAGNLIFAVADPDDIIEESDDQNNTNNTGSDCEYEPPPVIFTPQLEWAWNSSLVMPNHLNVTMTPAVIDLNDDQVPDVIFGATDSTTGSMVVIGVLRALSGADGSELFTVTHPGLRISTSASVAVGDIDLDGRPEIIACDASNVRLVAFEHDGTFKWRSATLEAINMGAPSIADLDGDGTPEIVIGRQVLDNSGAIRWSGTFGSGGLAFGSLSVVADLNLDGTPEVVAGNTAYVTGGIPLWQVSLPDGYNAIGNFDADDLPEVVLVSNGVIWLLEGETGLIKWFRDIPGAGRGGPPTVADFDGDGEAEIGVAGGSHYVVFENDETVKWTAVIQDTSSQITGSSVFDFEGDGSAEVVYSDERNLRIYDGSTGAVLFEAPLSSCTWHEYPLVVDVDADGNSELLAVANNNCGFGPQRGVYVYGDTHGSWVATRGLWNQHTYHVTNINDDGSIPASEMNNWLQPGLNNYRAQRMNEAGPLTAPDLTASLIGFDSAPCPDNVAISARIGNGGAYVAPAGVDVAFYDGEILLGVAQTTADLEPGEFEEVTLEVAAPFEGTVCVVADDDGTGEGRVNECDETNNSCCGEISAVCNRPPEVTCVEPLEVCADIGMCSASLACDGGIATCQDPDMDETQMSCVPPGPYGFGLTDVMATCDDPWGGTGSALCSVTVNDCEAPVLTAVSVSPAVLWPPNHKMRSVEVEVVASDNCDTGMPTCLITSVTSNEPEDGCGKKDAGPDSEITGDLTVDLRSERCGGGDGRVYTINLSCTDTAGNATDGSTLVTVRHDKGD
jgi:hypothetical protein